LILGLQKLLGNLSGQGAGDIQHGEQPLEQGMLSLESPTSLKLENHPEDAFCEVGQQNPILVDDSRSGDI